MGAWRSGREHPSAPAQHRAPGTTGGSRRICPTGCWTGLGITSAYKYKCKNISSADPHGLCKTGEAVLRAGTAPGMLTGPEPASSSHRCRLTASPLLILCFGCRVQSLKWKKTLYPAHPSHTGIKNRSL